MLPGVRPVPLEIVIQSFDIANLEARTSAMARPAYTAVSNTLKEAATPAGAKSAILFVPTRKQARLTALDLLTYAAADGEPNRFLQARHALLHPRHDMLRRPRCHSNRSSPATSWTDARSGCTVGWRT